MAYESVLHSAAKLPSAAMITLLSYLAHCEELDARSAMKEDISLVEDKWSAETIAAALGWEEIHSVVTRPANVKDIINWLGPQEGMGFFRDPTFYKEYQSYHDDIKNGTFEGIQHRFYFRTIDHAILFKLRWG